MVELLLQLEDKQQIMPNDVVTQNKHMYSLYIGSLCKAPVTLDRIESPNVKRIRIFVIR